MFEQSEVNTLKIYFERKKEKFMHKWLSTVQLRMRNPSHQPLCTKKETHNTVNNCKNLLKILNKSIHK